MLNSDDRKLTLDDLVEIRRQFNFEEAAEPQPEPRERIMTVSELTDGLELTEATRKCFQDTDWKERRAAEIGQGINEIPCCVSTF